MKLYFQEVGNGPPMVILHGIFGSSDNWRTLSLRMGEEFTVYSLDLRNHGRSPHADTHTIPEMAADLKQFLEDEELTNVVLIGHSMGGKVAMHYALHHPDRVGRLVVADISPRTYPAQHSREIEAMQAARLEGETNRKALEAQLTAHGLAMPVVQFLMKGLNRREDDTFNWRFNLDVLAREYPRILDGVTAAEPFLKPTLFMRGELSRYITDADEPAIRSLFPHAHIVTVPGSGHWIHAEKPEGFLEALSAFLHVRL